MKRKNMTAVALGLGWLASLGAVFVLGILSAFAFHLGPGGAVEADGDLTLAQRDLVLTIERYAGSPVDIAALFSVTDDTAVPEQLEQTIRAILREEDPELRRMATQRLVRGLPVRRVLGAIRFLQEIPESPVRNQVIQPFLETWGTEDGRSAIAFAASLPDPLERQFAIRAVLRGWSGKRPSDAWNWVVEREGGSGRSERWLEAIVENLGATDRDTALSLLERLPGEAFQERMALVVMEQILQTEEPRTALTWLGQLPEAVVGPSAAYLAERWAQTEPRAAAEWLSTSFPAELEGIGAVVREWTYAFPVAAADWVWETFNGRQRLDLMDVVSREWIANDGPAPLAGWINRHGPDPTLDRAISNLAIVTADVDPSTALVWAQLVMDPDSRSMLEILIGKRWLRISPDDAAQALPVMLESNSARAALLEPEYEIIEDTGLEGEAVPFEEEPPLNEDETVSFGEDPPPLQ